MPPSAKLLLAIGFPVALCTGVGWATAHQAHLALAALGPDAPAALGRVAQLALGATAVPLVGALVAGPVLWQTLGRRRDAARPATSPEDAPAASRATPAAFPALLAAVDGDAALYAELLGDARQSLADEGAALRAALRADRLPEAARHAHTVCTLAALLGADALEAHAAAVQDAAAAADLSAAVDAFLPLHAALQPVGARLGDALAALPAALPAAVPA